MKKISVLFLFMIPLVVSAQNLTGTWMGYGGGTEFIKMVITHRGDSLFGYTYDEGSGYCKATFLGRYDKKRKRLTGRGIEMIENTPNHVLVDYDLNYISFQGAEYLREPARPQTMFDMLFGSPAPLVLKRVSRQIDNPRPPAPKAVTPPAPKPKPAKPPVAAAPKPLPKKIIPAQPAAPPPAPEKKITTQKKIEPVITPAEISRSKALRTTKMVQTIYTASDTVTLILYDNGEVDGDTVSVFFDNKLILEKYRISDKGKTIILPIDKSGKPHSIELFAHNLGTIPPNTALLIITTSKERHELRASYDLSTNARIDIVHKPD